MDKMDKLKRPEIQYRPDVRWWLAEGFHTDETLVKEVKELYEAGFGAVEFLAMEEPGADSKLYGWGSEEWVHDSNTIVAETTKHGMGVSMTSGTNWSNANLITITPDDRAASKELDYAVETVKAGQTRTGKIRESRLFMAGVTRQELEAVVAIRISGEEDGKVYLDAASAVVLTEKVSDYALTWTAPEDGDYLLFFFWIHGTGQTAEPSVSVSYTINYIDHDGIDAFIDYWESTVLTPELKENLEKSGRGMMYMDSLELATFGNGGQLWGYHFREEFEKRRGYDLTPYLPFIVKEAGMMQPVFHYHYHSKDEIFAEKLYNDLYQTMTDMYMENMLKPMQEWLHSHNMQLRAEISYGLPFEISQPGKYVDGIETESLEFASQIESYRNLAGPAHIYNRIYSSETGATLLNYMMGLEFYTQIIYTQFAAGVTRTVLHGYSSIRGSEASTEWPGHEGMWPVFSERFGSRQPAFRHYKDWTAMVARYQMILRQGRPRMDLGILRLDYNFNNLICFGTGEEELYEKMLMRGNEGIYWKDTHLQNRGYTWDYFAPQILEEDFVDVEDGLLLPDGPGYQALIVYQEVLPVETAGKLVSLAEKGLKVFLVNGVNETIRPGGLTKTHKKAAVMTPFNDGKDQALAEIMEKLKALPNVYEVENQAETADALAAAGVLPRAAYAEENPKILTHTRENGGERYVFVYNMQYGETRSESFRLKIEGVGRVYRVDCWNAEISELGEYRAKDGYTEMPVTLAPGEAALYVIDENAGPVLHAVCGGGAKITIVDGKLTVSAEKSGTYQVKLSDGTEKAVEISAGEEIALPKWDLTVEDWNEGEKKVIREDRGLGIVTNEVYYETKKTPILAGTVELLPWKDLEKVGPEVSGIGYYKAKVNLPKGLDADEGAVLCIGSTSRNTAAVYVNGQKAKAVDFDRLRVDITELLKTGENEIIVEVSSTLNNRLLARGYYEKGKEMSKLLADNANNANEGAVSDESGEEFAPTIFHIDAKIRDSGMTGDVKIVRYRKKEI